MASAPDLPAPAAAAPPRDRSRLDHFIGLKRDNSEPWISRYADHIRLLLPLVALAVVLAGVIVPMFGATTGILVRDMPVNNDRGHYMRMDRPHFAGSNNKHRPYTVTADYAIQKTREEKIYDLFQPKADLLDEKQRWIAATADTGKYDQRLRLLDLSGNVTLFQDKGYTVTTDRARIDLEASAAYGDQPVRGHGPDGQIEAEGFHASERGARIVFTGRSRLILRGHDDSTDDSPASEPNAQPPAEAPAPGG